MPDGPTTCPRACRTTRPCPGKSTAGTAAAAAAAASSRRGVGKGRGSRSAARAAGKTAGFPVWPAEGQTTDDDKMLATGRLDPTQTRDRGKIRSAAPAGAEID